jgi:hypothetical protein
MSRRKRYLVPLVVGLLGSVAVAAYLVHGAAAPSRIEGVASAERPIPGRTELTRRAREQARPAGVVSALAPVAESDPRRVGPPLVEGARAASEVERLTAAVGLTEQQRGRAAKIVSVVERARSLAARDPDQDNEARRAREQQIDQQERLALLSVVTFPQQPLLDAYFRKR